MMGKFPHSTAAVQTVLFAVIVFTVVDASASTNGATVPHNPGFQTRITEKALAYAANEAINALSGKITGMKVPDQSGTAKRITYQMTSMTITSFTKPSGGITPVPNQGLKWSVTGAGVAMNGNWRYRYKRGWFKISDHGRFHVSANGISFSIIINVGKDSNGRPKLTATGGSCSIGSVRVKFRGGLSWIYNLFSGTIERKIKGILQEKLIQIVKEAVNVDGEKELQKLPVTVVLAKKFLLDYSLISTPTFTSSYMETHHKGEIFWNGDKTEAPFQPEPIPENNDKSKMVYLWLSDYMANSMGYTALKHGYLKYNFSSQDLPPENQSKLNTTCRGSKCIGKLVPPIGKKYPNCQLKLNMIGTKAPVLSIGDGSLKVNGSGTVNIYAQKKDRADILILTLKVTLGFTAQASLKGQLLYAKISNPLLELKVLKSNIGNVRVSAIQKMMKLALGMIVFPQLNALGSKGLVLPITDDIELSNSQLIIQKHSLMIATDLIYKPKI
ncbi:lipopolysaccharide-binding protein [Patella vulgata]|uniref:lipopolysaccharide-binding protein n=1 Tax=Patella vulgata TaxID=6465 RepID=UPI002180927C|nr:lipopolysaccharide-binding protein [Patella vulgata]